MIAGVDELVVGIRNPWLVRACDVVIFGLWFLVVLQVFFIVQFRYPVCLVQVLFL